MRTRDEIEADLEKYAASGGNPVYAHPLVVDVRPLLDARLAAEAERDAARAALGVAEAALARVRELCEWPTDAECRGGTDFKARFLAVVAALAPTPKPPSDLAQNVVPALVESIQWAVKQIDAALEDTRMSAAAMSWLRTIREGLVSSSGDVPQGSVCEHGEQWSHCVEWPQHIFCSGPVVAALAPTPEPEQPKEQQ